MTTRKIGKRYPKMAAKCPKCGTFHSVYAAELAGERCILCRTRLLKPASFLLGKNIVKVADVKARDMVKVVRREQVYVQKELMI